ncbi:sortase B protein-sorting domain-containing protein [Intestinimonas sp.]|uniref:sortase B protein-sorting domain-containing protein n=1 Tax=Intestinimonas sp. TaxID=1965293 RepID=UPI00260B2627|nr:sortase B protein-sorting domain-containing protein [Intestinimonas sp.]
MHRQIWRGLLTAVLGFSLAVRVAVPAQAASAGYTRTYDTKNNTVVYTLSAQAGEQVTIDCADAANTLMAGLTQPGQSAQVGIRIENESDRTYSFSDYAFTTENHIDRDVTVGPPSPALRTQPPRQAGAVTGQLGFDGKYIPSSMTVLRSVTGPLKAVYGVRDSADMTLRQVAGLEERLEELGYSSYAAYLLEYYKTHCANSAHTCGRARRLADLHPSHQCEILGSAAGGYTGQSEIRQPRSISAAELEGDPAYARFLSWGWGAALTGDAGARQLRQDYELLETDPELIALGYRYLYAYGLYFSFDGSGIRLPHTPQQLSSDGLSLWNYLHRLDPVEKQVEKLKTIVLKPGESVTLPHVTLAAQLPNSYDLRGIDFGFSLTFVTGEPVVPPVPTDPVIPPGPTGPVDPPGPTGPVDPPGPTDPIDPPGPTEPIDPPGPTDPAEPPGPTDPAEPPGPTGPVDPPGPTDPADPPGPTDPIDPPGPTEPADPTEPDGPGGEPPLEQPGGPPKTGDETRMELWLSLLAGASVLFFLLVGRLRKERRER